MISEYIFDIRDLLQSLLFPNLVINGRCFTVRDHSHDASLAQGPGGFQILTAVICTQFSCLISLADGGERGFNIDKSFVS